MGKLHTLRRAIERDPDEFRSMFSKDAYGAIWSRWSGKWVQADYCDRSYRSFVRRVLQEIEARGNQ